MNAAEQRAHRTVTQSLEQRIEALETLLLQVSKNCDWLKHAADHVPVQIEERRSHILQEVGAAIGNHINMTFSARLRWLILGR